MSAVFRIEHSDKLQISGLISCTCLWIIGREAFLLTGEIANAIVSSRWVKHLIFSGSTGATQSNRIKGLISFSPFMSRHLAGFISALLSLSASDSLIPHKLLMNLSVIVREEVAHS